MSQADIIYITNDNMLKLTLTNPATGLFINSGTVNLTSLKDAADVEVTGQTFPTAFVYEVASDGIWRVTLEEELVLTANTPYFAHIDIDAGGDLKAFIKKTLIARERTS